MRCAVSGSNAAAAVAVLMVTDEQKRWMPSA
jgi:hypothetical protein